MKREKLVSLILVATITGVLITAPPKTINAQVVNNPVQQEMTLLDFDIEAIPLEEVQVEEVETQEVEIQEVEIQEVEIQEVEVAEVEQNTIIIPLVEETTEDVQAEVVEESTIIIPLVNEAPAEETVQDVQTEAVEAVEAEIVQDIPVEKVVEGIPVEKVVEDVPVEKVVEGIPVEKVVEDVPVEKVVEGIPVEKVVEDVPVEKVVEGIPVEKVVEGIPVEKVVEGIPVEKVVEDIPVEKVVEDIPEVGTIIIPLVDQPTEKIQEEAQDVQTEAVEESAVIIPLVEAAQIEEVETEIVEETQTEETEAPLQLAQEAVEEFQTEETEAAVPAVEEQSSEELVTGTTVTAYIQTNENQNIEQISKEKKLVFLAPSTQYENEYYKGITNEGTEMNKIMDIIESKLLQVEGLEIVRNDPNKSVGGYIRDANNLDVDLYFSLHSNGKDGRARGPEVWSYSPVGEAAEFAQTVYDNLLEIYPDKEYGRGPKQTAGLAELNSVNAPSIIAEIAFHDNSEDSKWILENEELIADTMVKSILEHLGME